MVVSGFQTNVSGENWLNFTTVKLWKVNQWVIIELFVAFQLFVWIVLCIDSFLHLGTECRENYTSF